MDALRESSSGRRSLRGWWTWLVVLAVPASAHATDEAEHASVALYPATPADAATGGGSASGALPGDRPGPTRTPETRDEQTPSAPAPLPPNRWRAALEMAIALGGGTAWYVLDDRNVLDWDRPSLRQRLTGEAWRYDNNGPVINFLLHPLSGAAFYSLARGNRLGVAESFAYGVAASTAWEYVIEFKERISINDMIVTPAGGFAIGAFADKLARYLNDVPPTGALHAAAQWIFGPSIRLHRGLDGEPPPEGVARDSLGLAATFWHAFELEYQGGWLGQLGHPSWAVHDFGFLGTLASLPGYRRPGRFGRWFYDADISRLGFGMDWARSDAGSRLETDTLLAGYHRQSLSGRAASPRGFMWTAAAALEYRFRHTRAFGFDDREGVLGLPGPAFDLYAASKAIEAQLSLRANPEFAGQTSLAAPQWRETHPGVRTKAIVEREGYFYGWGGSLAFSGEASVGPFWSRAHLRSGWYDSQEGLDRRQERLDDDTEFHEIIREYGLSLGVELCSSLRVGVAREVRHRLSTAGRLTANRSAERVGGMVQASF